MREDWIIEHSFRLIILLTSIALAVVTALVVLLRDDKANVEAEVTPASRNCYEWEDVNTPWVNRLRVPEGWLVRHTEGGVTFVPDLSHRWNLRCAPGEVLRW